MGSAAPADWIKKIAKATEVCFRNKSLYYTIKRQSLLDMVVSICLLHTLYYHQHQQFIKYSHMYTWSSSSIPFPYM